MKTQIINTLSEAPTDFDVQINDDFMVQYNYVDGLRMLRKALSEEFVRSGDVDLYIRARAVSKRINDILGRS